jgi:N-acyl-D-aspartate/D-glutamate deacylase
MHDLVVRGGTIIDITGEEQFAGDVAIDDGVITAVGARCDKARRELDAYGMLVMPGFVDIHTHYDAQVTWDPLVSSSCWHGVTTVVMGNCGVGFAPVRSDRRRWFIGLMEAVEDIPASVLEEALPWDWESFPEYLDALARQRRAVDVAALLPHSALRIYVMGERGADHRSIPTSDDLAAMHSIAREAAQAGALGFSTASLSTHRTGEGGPVPCYAARSDELEAIAMGLRRGGRRFLEVATTFSSDDIERGFGRYRNIVERTGCELSMPIAQNPSSTDEWRSLLRLIEDAARKGVSISAQIAVRPIGALFGLRSSRHPFVGSRTFQSIAHLEPNELRCRLAQPEIADVICREAADRPFIDPANLFPLILPIDYFPTAELSVVAQAATLGISPIKFMYDFLAADPSVALLYFPARNWDGGDDGIVAEQLASSVAVPGLGDGGAHCSQICDMSSPTTLLTYWGRDRRQGPTLALPRLVSLQTARTARLAGLADRGMLKPGLKADINVVDWENLAVALPRMVSDLPANGRRLVQRATGYRATLVAGEVVFENGEHTGALPGRVLR